MSDNVCQRIQQLISEVKTLHVQLDAGLSVLPDNYQKTKPLIDKLLIIKEKLNEKYLDLTVELYYRDWHSYKNGQNILHYVWPKNFSNQPFWRTHPQGVIIDQGRQLLLNSKDLLYEGDFSWWGSHPQGLVVQKGNQALLNGKELLYKGNFDAFFSHPKGIITFVDVNSKKENKKVFLNGETLLYQGDWDDLQPHLQGIVIRKGNKLLLNGKDLLYEGDFDSWEFHPRGFVIKIGKQILLNGKTLLYEGDCDDFQYHPRGIIVRQGYDWFFYNQSEEEKINE